MGDEEHGALELVQAVDEGLAGVHVQVVGGLVEDHEVGGAERQDGEGEAGLLAAGQVADLDLRAALLEPEPAEPGAHPIPRGVGHVGPHLLEGGELHPQALQVILGEVRDLELGRVRHLAVRRVQLPGNEACQGGLAVPVGAQKGDPVVAEDAQMHVREHRAAGIVAHRGPCQLDQRRRLHLRRGEVEDHLSVRGHGLQWRQALEHLHPALGLLGLGRLGLEPVDERLQVLAPSLHLHPGRLVEGGAGGAGLREHVEPAGVHGQRAVLHEERVLGDLVEQLPVVADDDEGVGVTAQVAHEPQDRLQIQVVGGLVEEQEIRLGEQGRRQGHPHLPAA